MGLYKMVDNNVVEFKIREINGYDNLQKLDGENRRVLRCVDCKSTAFHLANSDVSSENDNDVDLIICVKCGRLAWLGEAEDG